LADLRRADIQPICNQFEHGDAGGENRRLFFDVQSAIGDHDKVICRDPKFRRPVLPSSAASVWSEGIKASTEAS
jgi:hypothetical protein